VHGFDAVGGSADFTLFGWTINNSLAGSTNMTAIPTPTTATLAGTGNVALTFSGLTAGLRYLGTNLHIQNGTTVVGTTVVGVRP